MILPLLSRSGVAGEQRPRGLHEKHRYFSDIVPRDFVDFLRSPRAQAIYAEYGFEPIAP